jgi:hypothetical protein
MEITRLEKAALLTTGAGASFMTLLWNLAVQVDSANGWVTTLRIIFAAISFLAFDLVLWSLIESGWSRSGIAALIVVSTLSGAIGLEVAGVVSWPALHAAPALALAAFGAHLMIRRPTLNPQPSIPAISQAVQVNVNQALPPTVAAYIAAKAAELPDASPDELASAIGVGVMSVRKVLQLTEETTQ